MDRKSSLKKKDLLLTRLLSPSFEFAYKVFFYLFLNLENLTLPFVALIKKKVQEHVEVMLSSSYVRINKTQHPNCANDITIMKI